MHTRLILSHPRNFARERVDSSAESAPLHPGSDQDALYRLRSGIRCYISCTYCRNTQTLNPACCVYTTSTVQTCSSLSNGQPDNPNTQRSHLPDFQSNTRTPRALRLKISFASKRTGLPKAGGSVTTHAGSRRCIEPHRKISPFSQRFLNYCRGTYNVTVFGWDAWWVEVGLGLTTYVRTHLWI